MLILQRSCSQAAVARLGPLSRRRSSGAAGLAQDPSLTGLYNQGNALARLGRYQDAISQYDQVLADDPNQEDAAFNKALLEAAGATAATGTNSNSSRTSSSNKTSSPRAENLRRNNRLRTTAAARARAAARRTRGFFRIRKCRRNFRGRHLGGSR